MIKKLSAKPNHNSILTINGGSSSIKFALYETGEQLKRIFYGEIKRIGLQGTTLTFNGLTRNDQGSRSIEASDHKSAVNSLIDWLEEQKEFSSVRAVGHRVVHGMNHIEPETITQELLDELHRIAPYDPDHLPGEIELIEVFRKRHPKLPQVACFDTSFHCTMPRIAKLLPIPRRFDEKGIQRYGFHGLSYSYLILAHLGSGASLAAVRNGKSIDTSMGFTPAAGLTMGTRPGDLDPGVAWYIIKSENLTPKQFNKLINHESGLLGISETSSDMQDLLAKENDDIRAAEAVGLFCYQAKKWIGSFAAALGGLDTLVFAGGIGENSPVIRSRVCDGLGFLGIKLEEKQNITNAPVISTKNGSTVVRVIHTDEEWMIANIVSQILKLDSEKE
jgi:acetate kinase